MPATKCSCHHRSWHGVTNNYKLGWAAVLTGMWVIASGIDIKFSIVWNKNAQVLQKDAQIWAVFTDVCWVESVPSSLTSCREQRTLHHEVLSKTQMSSEQVVHCQAISDHGNHLSSFRLLLLAASFSCEKEKRLFKTNTTPVCLSEHAKWDFRKNACRSQAASAESIWCNSHLFSMWNIGKSSYSSSVQWDMHKFILEWVWGSSAVRKRDEESILISLMYFI